MLKVALTGGMATGKSYVVEQLRRRGVPCLDADDLAHGVTAAGTEATAAIAERFGASVLEPSGAVDRTKLGAIVFSDPSARRDLETIVHPAVYRAISAGMRGFELVGGYPLVVADIPLLYESGHASEFDRVIVTACQTARQLERLRARGLTDAEVARRMSAQMPTEEKLARADYVIRTDGTYEETDAQIDEILESLIP